MRIAVSVGFAIALSTVLSGHAQQPGSPVRQDMVRLFDAHGMCVLGPGPVWDKPAGER